MKPCSCIKNDCDYEPTAFFRQIMRKAKKIHTCYECLRKIQPGEKYEYAIAKQDGEIWSAKTCPDCLSMRDTFYDGCYYFGNIWDVLAEHIYEMNGEISEDCLVPLTPAARAHVCGIIEDYWERCLGEEEE